MLAVTPMRLTDCCWFESQVAAAKIAIDMETNDEGKLTETQIRTYQASMRHEHKIYDSLLKAGGATKGIPTVHFAGKQLWSCWQC